MLSRGGGVAWLNTIPAVQVRISKSQGWPQLLPAHTPKAQGMLQHGTWMLTQLLLTTADQCMRPGCHQRACKSLLQHCQDGQDPCSGNCTKPNPEALPQ